MHLIGQDLCRLEEKAGVSRLVKLTLGPSHPLQSLYRGAGSVASALRHGSRHRATSRSC